MKIHAFVPTRTQEFSPTLRRLSQYLSSIGVKVNILINENSIFTAFSTAIKNLSAENDDIVIFCHDDIEILMDKEVFLDELIKGLSLKNVGFVGVAGTQCLNKTAIWWDQRNKLKGFAFHGKDQYEMYPSYFGALFAPVVVLDGLFMAARVKTLKQINLEKPKQFKGEWDFYDIEYTIQAYELGLTNYVVPIILRHESPGELVGRTSWHDNRQVFQNIHMLPCQIPDKK